MSLPKSTSHRIRRCIIWALSASFILAVITAIYLGNQMPVLLKSMYAEWAAAEVVMVTHHETGRLPNSWNDLAPYYDKANPTPRNGILFDQLCDLIEIDFEELPKLENEAKSDQLMTRKPHVINTRNWVPFHWIKPNQTLIQYFKTGVVTLYEQPQALPE